MQDLLDKIEQLKKSLAVMKPKENSLVPALSVPTVKPISISSTPTAKPKLPGIAPASTKDPVKMAEQLKNPRPKKPKIEILKFEKNGQWSLDKATSTKFIPKGQQCEACGMAPATHSVTEQGDQMHVCKDCHWQEYAVGAAKKPDPDAKS